MSRGRIRPVGDFQIQGDLPQFLRTTRGDLYAALPSPLGVSKLSSALDFKARVFRHPGITKAGDGQRLSLRALDARKTQRQMFLDLVIGETNKNFKAVIPAKI